jgi:imidazole glycerol-phosphate synthase subunit HisH
MGNLRSVENALTYLGHAVLASGDPDVLQHCERFVLPGVGAFGSAVSQLHARGLVDLLDEQVRRGGKPLLGICLGMQLLAAESEEHGLHNGLGWFSGRLERFEPEAERLAVPHMGWNAVNVVADHPVFSGVRGETALFYFVHSFRLGHSTGDRSVIATAEHCGTFVAAFGSRNVVGVQFHPEKSQDNGLELLEKFIAWTP